MTDETVSADPQPLGEDSTGEEWTEMQEMLSVALDEIEDQLFELTGVERTREAMEKMSERMHLAVQWLIHHTISEGIPPGNGIPVERDVITMCFFAVGMTRRMIEKWEEPQEAVKCLGVAARALGSLEMQKFMPTVAKRIAAHASHAEDRETAERIKAWYRENEQHYLKRMDDAAIAVMKIEPVAFSTARKHIAVEAKKLRSARRV